MFKRALICTDFSDSLDRLAKFVPDLAKGGMEHIVFFHSVPLMTSREIPCADDEKVSRAREMLSVAKSALPAGTTVEIDVVSGRDNDNILRAVKTHQPDIIISGMATRSALNERVFGSTTMEIVDKLNVPMLVLRPQLISTYREAELAQRCQHMFDYLLVPYDGSSSAKKLLGDIRAKIQTDPNSALKTCLLCYVVEGGGRIPVGDLAKAAQAELDRAKSELAGLGTEIKTQVITEVRTGNPLDEILKSGEVHDISAIAICPSKGGGFFKMTVPSFTSAVLRASWHPVIHFPREK